MSEHARSVLVGVGSVRQVNALSPKKATDQRDAGVDDERAKQDQPAPEEAWLL